MSETDLHRLLETLGVEIEAGYEPHEPAVGWIRFDELEAFMDKLGQTEALLTGTGRITGKVTLADQQVTLMVEPTVRDHSVAISQALFDRLDGTSQAGLVDGRQVTPMPLDQWVETSTAAAYYDEQYRLLELAASHIVNAGELGQPMQPVSPEAEVLGQLLVDRVYRFTNTWRDQVNYVLADASVLTSARLLARDHASLPARRITPAQRDVEPPLR